MKKLYKSKENRMILGIIGGIGEYINIDPIILRLFFLLIVLATAIIPGIIFYLIAGIIIPQKTKEVDK